MWVKEKRGRKTPVRFFWREGHKRLGECGFRRREGKAPWETFLERRA
jgi:hypothetical protein